MSDILFCMVDPAVPEGEYMSSTDPGQIVTLADYENDIVLYMQNSSDIVVDAASINIRYSYPLDKPVIFAEKAPNGLYFTRADIARVIGQRYEYIYDMENATSGVAETNIPGMYNRVTTDGRFGIWGHVLGDLVLHTVSYESSTDTYNLGIDS